MKKLILIDDHKMLRKGISSYITENSDWQIAGEAGAASEVPELVKKINASRSDEDSIVAVVDIQLKEKGESLAEGFKLVKFLAGNGIYSVVFSSHDTGACIDRAMSPDVGAKGFVSKLSDEKILLEAINMVAAGKTYIQPDLVTSFIESRSVFSILTKREMEVIKLIQDGLSNERIAEEMNIKNTTLENYISIIYDKTGCNDRLSLLAKLG
ncbi:MAG: response regulator transcription factor [Treponema sp.]|nr:response regulator transcription factor [Treponema sp.]